MCCFAHTSNRTVFRGTTELLLCDTHACVWGISSCLFCACDSTTRVALRLWITTALTQPSASLHLLRNTTHIGGGSIVFQYIITLFYTYNQPMLLLYVWYDDDQTHALALIMVLTNLIGLWFVGGSNAKMANFPVSVKEICQHCITSYSSIFIDAVRYSLTNRP